MFIGVGDGWFGVCLCYPKGKTNKKERKKNGAERHHLQNPAGTAQPNQRGNPGSGKHHGPIHRDDYEKGEKKMMEKGRALAFQVSEELFRKVKEFIH